jgi:mannose-6-phosphate isomerase-like protein (cupin superfamily)
MMEIKSTLKVYNESELTSFPGVVQGQIQKQLVGDAAHPSERITVRTASFPAGIHERLHWHLIEAFYYVISGKAVMKDIEGTTYDIGPGSVIYAPPGIAASHSWDIKEPLKLIAVRGTTDPEKSVQFDVDPVTKESSASIEHLTRKQAINFKSLY